MSAQFFNYRSCNDDNVPYYVLLGSNATSIHLINDTPDPYLEAIDAKLEQICAEIEMTLNSDGKLDNDTPDPYLQAIDAKLEQICAEIEMTLNNDGELVDKGNIRPDFDDDGENTFLE
jgi:hypothetical protein